MADRTDTIITNHLLSVSRETESDSRSDCDPTKSTDQLAKSIRREVVKLSDKWSGLLTGLEIWQRKLDDALPVSGGAESSRNPT